MSIGSLLIWLLFHGFVRITSYDSLTNFLVLVATLVIISGVFVLLLRFTVASRVVDLCRRSILRRKRIKHYSANSVVGMFLAEATVTQTIVGSLPTFSTK